MKKVHIDMIVEDTSSIEAATNEIINEVDDFLIKVKVLELAGPAGGNPSVELEGPAANINTFLINAGFASDEQEIDELYLV